MTDTARRQIVEIEQLVHEHAYRPISGEILAIGRQGIAPKGPEILDILSDRSPAPL